jgi:hypothetical protein
LIKALLDEAMAELQVQAQDIAALAAHLEMVLPSQQAPPSSEENGRPPDEPEDE